MTDYLVVINLDMVVLGVTPLLGGGVFVVYPLSLLDYCIYVCLSVGLFMLWYLGVQKNKKINSFLPFQILRISTKRTPKLSHAKEEDSLTN